MWKNGMGGRSAQGASTETPKVSRWVEKWEGVSPSPSDYAVWGSIVSSPNGVRGEAPENFDF